MAVNAGKLLLCLEGNLFCNPGILEKSTKPIERPFFTALL